MSHVFRSSQQVRHKVFVSYYHYSDQYYRDLFEEWFGHLFISKSVKPGDIDTDLSTEYIKRLIQEGYISDTSVVLVLVGPKTHCRKHVDWEISAGLNKKVGGYSGLLGILLPEFPLTSENRYNPDDLPPRLNDNVQSGYAKLYTWAVLCSRAEWVRNAIQTAFDDRITKAASIVNSRLQFINNRCS